MVSITSLLISLALVCPPVLGRVTNFTAPSTVKAGEDLTAVLEVRSYIQNWDDFGVRPLPRPPRSRALHWPRLSRLTMR